MKLQTLLAGYVIAVMAASFFLFGFTLFAANHFIEKRDACRQEVMSRCLYDGNKDYECKVIAEDGCSLF